MFLPNKPKKEKERREGPAFAGKSSGKSTGVFNYEKTNLKCRNEFLSGKPRQN